jgi:hypothetical protein
LMVAVFISSIVTLFVIPFIMETAHSEYFM